MARTDAELAATGKGLLAADESSGTIEKRFKAVNVPSTEQTRRDYRELLFSAPALAQCALRSRMAMTLETTLCGSRTKSLIAYMKLLRLANVLPHPGWSGLVD